MYTHQVGSLLLHWVLGITFMLFVTVSVLQLREVMHPEVCAALLLYMQLLARSSFHMQCLRCTVRSSA